MTISHVNLSLSSQDKFTEVKLGLKSEVSLLTVGKSIVLRRGTGVFPSFTASPPLWYTPLLWYTPPLPLSNIPFFLPQPPPKSLDLCLKRLLAQTTQHCFPHFVVALVTHPDFFPWRKTLRQYEPHKPHKPDPFVICICVQKLESVP